MDKRDEYIASDMAYKKSTTIDFGKIYHHDSSDEDEIIDESTPILRSNSNYTTPNSFIVQNAKLKHLVHGIYGINYLFLIFSFSIIFSLIIFTVHLYQEFPLYIVFIPLWIGHLLMIIAVSNIFLLINLSMKGRSSDMLSFRKWFKFNQSRFSLFLFCIRLIVEFLFFQVLIFLSEFFLYLGSIGILESSLCLIPLIILCVINLFFSLLTKCNHTLNTLSTIWITLFLVVLYLQCKGTIAISWIIIFLPFDLFSIQWICIFWYIAASSFDKVYHLQKRKQSILGLYFLGFLLLLLSFLLYSILIQNYQLTNQKKAFILISFIISITLLSIAYSMDIFDFLHQFVTRKGITPPLPLIKDSEGYWGSDDRKSPRNFFLLGDIYLELTHYRNRESSISSSITSSSDSDTETNRIILFKKSSSPLPSSNTYLYNSVFEENH